MHQARSLIYLVIAVVNVIISIPLGKLWWTRCLTGTAISLIIGNIFMTGIITKRKLI